MANRYWVGGSGTWDNTSTTNWSTASGGAPGASAPTVTDAAIFDANSNTGTNDFTVTLGTSPACQTLNTTGIDPANAMTVGGTGNLEVRGTSFILTNKVSWTNTGTISFTFIGGTTCNINGGGISIASNVNLVGGGSFAQTWNFGATFTCTGNLTLSGGNFSTAASVTVSVSAFLTSGPNTKTAALGTSASLNITGNNKTVLDLVTGGTGLTWNINTIGFTYSGSTGTRTINVGATAAISTTCNISAGSDTVVFTSGDSIKALNFTGFTGTWNNVAMTINGALTTVSGMTTGSGSGAVTLNTTSTLTTGGITYNFPLTINGSAQTITLSGNLTLDAASTLTLTQGTLAQGANNISVGRFSSTGTSTRSVTKSSGTFTVSGNNATVAAITGSGLTMSSFTITSNYSGSTGTRTFNITTQTPAINITAGSDTVTFTASDTIGTLNFTGFTGTWSNVALSISGGLTVVSGMTVTAGTNTVTFTGSGTVTTNSKTLDFPVTVSGSGITTTLGDNLTLGTSRTFTLTQGTVALGNNTLSTGVFTSSGASTRAVTRSTSGNITVTGNAATVATFTGSNATYGGGAGILVNCSYSGSTGTRTINCTNSTLGFAVNAGSDTVTFTASNTIALLDFTGFSGTWSNVALTVNGNLVTSSGMTVGSGANTLTISGANLFITPNGKTYDFPLTINMTAGNQAALLGNLTVGSTRTTTLTQGTLSLGGNTLSTGVFTSSGTSTRAVTRTFGNITVTGNAATVATLTGSGATYDSGTAITANYSGSTGTRNFNSTETGVGFNITAGSDIVSFTSANTIGALDFTGFTGSWNNVDISINSNLTVSSGMTVSSGSNVVAFIGSGTITSNGKTLDFPVSINGAGITVTAGDNLTFGSGKNFNFLQGTFNANNKNISLGFFLGSNSNTRTLALGSGAWTVNGAGASAWNCDTSTNLTVTGTGTISMASASAKTFAGGGKTWPILQNAGAGALTISGSNTFTTITNSVQPTTFTFTSGTTQTVTNFTVNGTAGNVVTINSSSAGSQATLSKSSGTVTVQFCSIQDSNATGGATWSALASVNNGNNTGWSFAGGNFLMFLLT